MRKSRLLLIFFLVFPVTMINPCTIGLDHNIPYGLLERFVVPYLGNCAELPSLSLLQTALDGYEMLVQEHGLSRPEVLTIIDFSLPSDQKRLWVLDLLQAKVLFHCLVSHGRRSGELMAEYFSNTPGSNASSLGFYITGETYIGNHGLSLTLDGIEYGINDNARERAIIIHGADYVSADFIRKYGRLGRSLGCPAIPEEMKKEIIQSIKGGSCLFIYKPSESYMSESQIIRKIASVKK